MPRIATALACLAALLCASAAHAQDAPLPIDETLVEQSCRLLNPGGTGGNTDPTRADPATGLPATWPAARDGLLPGTIELRSSAETFNRIYEFAMRDGDLYAKRRATGEPWRAVPLPPCLDGRLTGISADDDELIALDRARRIYTMDNALKDANLWNWTSRWGPPVWTGPGFALPGGTDVWSWSVVSRAEDGNWTDPAGNRYPVGDFKVSHIWGLRTGGQRFTFWDPWLPLDDSYEMCGPQRGRFRAVNMSASGSHVFVIGANGDMFTRLYDFDISGHDPVFFPYSYEDQRGKGDGSPIQLPAEPWKQQPKIPGTITDAISIHKVGADRIHGILRVEGERDGKTGYWERDLAAAASTPWKFHATGRELTGEALANPARDTSTSGLGPTENTRFVMKENGVEAELVDFNVYCSPARLIIRENGRAREVVLHHVDGLRQASRGRGLDDEEREQYGQIESPRGTFEPVHVFGTRDAIVIQERGWRLQRADLPGAPRATPRCVARRASVSADAIGDLRIGMTRDELLRAVPEPDERGSRAWRWCVDGGGELSVAFRSGRVVFAVTTGTRHVVGSGVRTGSSTRSVRRRFRGARVLSDGIVRTSARSTTVLGVTRKRVTFVAVTTRGSAGNARLLRKYLRATGAIR